MPNNNQNLRDKAVKEYKRRRRNGILVSVVFTLAFFILFVRVPAALLKSDDASEVGHTFSDYIAVIDVDGEMSDSSSSSYNHGWIINIINELVDDSNNEALLIRVNTPGGSVYYSDELYNKILEYKKETKRPVYIYMQDMAASGGYYISAPADKIYANRNCWTGSIGVTTGTMVNVKGLLDKLGIKAEAITSGRNKAMGSSTQEMTAEQRAILQSLIDESYDRFVDIVAKGRKLNRDKVKELADGRIYTATQAKNLGLIDEICSEEDAMSDIEKASGLGKTNYLYLTPPEPTIWDTIKSLKTSLGKHSSGELGNYNELIDLARGGNIITISYICNIRK